MRTNNQVKEMVASLRDERELEDKPVTEDDSRYWLLLGSLRCLLWLLQDIGSAELRMESSRRRERPVERG